MEDDNVAPTVDELLDELAAYVQPDPIPDGWYSMKDIAEAAGVSVQKTKAMMKRRLDEGKVDRREFNKRPYFKVTE